MRFWPPDPPFPATSGFLRNPNVTVNSYQPDALLTPDLLFPATSGFLRNPHVTVLMNWTTNPTGWHGIALFTGALVLMSSLKMVFCLSSIVLRDLVLVHSWWLSPMGSLDNLLVLVGNMKWRAWSTLMIESGSVWSTLVTGLESRSTLMIENGIKIHTNETMGLLDEKVLEGVAMTTRGNLNNREWLLWW